MRRVWVVLALMSVLFAGGYWYYHGAWSTARDQAVALAAGDSDVPLTDNVWALGRDLPHERLTVLTEPGWRDLSGVLSIGFTISDPSSDRTVGMRITVEFDWDGWTVIGYGDIGG
jgi:hypothetical protein